MINNILPGISTANSRYLHFKYLKRSAEEGFIEAQHYLGIAYFEGIFTPKNDKLSLAWFREAARNGLPVSFINAGDLLVYGSPVMKEITHTFDPKIIEVVSQLYSKSKSNLKPNILFALSQYISAYRFGATYLEERMKILVKHLRTSGELMRD